MVDRNDFLLAIAAFMAGMKLAVVRWAPLSGAVGVLLVVGALLDVVVDVLADGEPPAAESSSPQPATPTARVRTTTAVAVRERTVT
jgi:hypothetical protein